ncbi:MAG: hypothetical protein E7174_05005 [Firmicutes bacterium]|nr:hypothetical protein [Bacillota bacterium]
MSSLYEIKSVIKKISSIENLGQHVCFFGGSVPYIYYNRESNREHSDIDVLVDEKYIDVIRQLAKQSNLYIPKFDSLNLDLGDDYGLKIFIDGVYVEFEPMFIDNGMLVRKSFSPNKEMAGTEMIPFEELTDLIVAIDIDGIKSYCQSPELIKAGKEQYKREKDLLDISFIDSQGIDIEKYHRVKKSLELSETSITSYEDLRSKKTL